MSFLNRLFRKGKAEVLTSSQPPLRRSLTEPSPSSNSRNNRNSSDKSDNDTFDVHGPSRIGPVRARRAGCDLTRSKTSLEVTSHSMRSSSSSAADSANDQGSTKTHQYRQLRAIHRSRLHTIMAAQDRQSKRSVVLKTFSKARMSSSLRARLENEVKHLRALAGVPGVVHMLSQTEDEDSIYIVLERVTGGTVIEMVANCGGRVPEHVLVPDVLIPLTLLLADLHRRGLVHRHIKPEHVLCTHEHGAVTLVDFADCVDKTQRCLNNRAGSLEYMAPEVLDKPTAEEVFHRVLYNGMSEEELPQYDEKADVWSLGVVVYEALTGCQPFLADSAEEMAEVQRQRLAERDERGLPRLITERPGLSLEAQSFLAEALQLDPINRASAERLLKHPLLQRYWSRHQVKQVALLASHPPAPSGSADSSASPLPSTAINTMGGRGSRSGGSSGQGSGLIADEVIESALQAAAASAGPCAVAPGGGSKVNVMVAAPLHFSVR